MELIDAFTTLTTMWNQETEVLYMLAGQKAKLALRDGPEAKTVLDVLRATNAQETRVNALAFALDELRRKM